MILPSSTRSLMAETGMPIPQRILFHVGFAAIMALCLGWTVLVLIVCWPLAVVHRLFRGNEKESKRE